MCASFPPHPCPVGLQNLVPVLLRHTERSGQAPRLNGRDNAMGLRIPCVHPEGTQQTRG